MYDVIALGELLIDFTSSAPSGQGNPQFEANPGGAPCNVLAMLAHLGRRAAFVGKVGDDLFGRMLKGSIAETGIDGCTAGTYFGVKFFSQFEQFVESFPRTHSVTAGYDDRRAFQVVFCLFYVTVDHLYYIIRFRNKFSYVVFYHFAFIICVQDFFLHHTFANGSHLGTVFGVDDGGNDVTAECRTDLIQQVFVSDTCSFIFMRTDFQ